MAQNPQYYHPQPQHQPQGPYHNPQYGYPPQQQYNYNEPQYNGHAGYPPAQQGYPPQHQGTSLASGIPPQTDGSYVAASQYPPTTNNPQYYQPAQAEYRPQQPVHIQQPPIVPPQHTSPTSNKWDLPPVPPFDWKAYQAKRNLDPKYIDDAKVEHDNKQLPFGADYQEMKEEFGNGCVFFFEFMKFIIVTNAVLIILQVINYLMYASSEKPSFSSVSNSTYGERSWYDDFFITSYQEKQKNGWMAINIIAIILTFVSSPLYYAIMQWRLPVFATTQKELDEEDSEPTDRMLRYNDNDQTLDTGSYYRTTGDRVCRRLCSFLVFAIGIIIQFLASWFITKNEDGNSAGAAFGIAVVVGVLNIVYGILSKALTEYEKWETFSRWKRSHSLKLIIFKLVNIVTVFAAKDYEKSAEVSCIYDTLGEQFLMLMLVDIFVMNLWEVLSTALQAKLMYQFADLVSSINGDEDNLPHFDLAREYLEIIYRQYLSIMSMVVFPLSIALATIGQMMEFWVDKFRLYKICGRPMHLSHSQKGFLSFNLTLIAVVAMFTPFAGSVWVLTGVTKSVGTKCKFP